MHSLARRPGSTYIVISISGTGFILSTRSGGSSVTALISLYPDRLRAGATAQPIMTRTTTRSQEDRRARTRQLLLAAAADQFANKGFHGTSAEAIAAAADRTTGALYDHFGGKSGLLVAIVEGWVEQSIIDITTKFSIDGSDLEGRLGSVWETVVDSEDDADQWLLLEVELWLHAARDPELAEAGAARLAVMRAALAEGIDEWSAEFGFPLPAPSAEVAAQMIGLLLGAAFQHRLDSSSFSRESIIRGIGRLLALPDSMAHSRHDVAIDQRSVVSGTNSNHTGTVMG